MVRAFNTCMTAKVPNTITCRLERCWWLVARFRSKMWKAHSISFGHFFAALCPRAPRSSMFRRLLHIFLFLHGYSSYAASKVAALKLFDYVAVENDGLRLCALGRISLAAYSCVHSWRVCWAEVAIRYSLFQHSSPQFGAVKIGG